MKDLAKLSEEVYIEKLNVLLTEIEMKIKEGISKGEYVLQVNWFYHDYEDDIKNIVLSELDKNGYRYYCGDKFNLCIHLKEKPIVDQVKEDNEKKLDNYKNYLIATSVGMRNMETVKAMLGNISEFDKAMLELEKVSDKEEMRLTNIESFKNFLVEGVNVMDYLYKSLDLLNSISGEDFGINVLLDAIKGFEEPEITETPKTKFNIMCEESAELISKLDEKLKSLDQELHDMLK